ncbi:MAG: hypothetical protein AAF416_03295 [Pseudomonadota bacterium]
MREPDKDLDELERLLGDAKTEYRALRHAGRMPEPQAHARRGVSRRLAIGASALVATTVLTIGALDQIVGSAGSAPSRLSMPSLAASPFDARPAGLRPAGLPLSFRRLQRGSTIPPRPSASRG